MLTCIWGAARKQGLLLIFVATGVGFIFAHVQFFDLFSVCMKFYGYRGNRGRDRFTWNIQGLMISLCDQKVKNGKGARLGCISGPSVYIFSIKIDKPYEILTVTCVFIVVGRWKLPYKILKRPSHLTNTDIMLLLLSVRQYVIGFLLLIYLSSDKDCMCVYIEGNIKIMKHYSIIGKF